MEIETADAVESFGKGVIVLVTGCLTGKDNVGRKFTQTFFVAPQENGYFVFSDIFRFIKDDESSQTNIIDESSPKPGGFSLLVYLLIFCLHFPIVSILSPETHAPDHLLWSFRY